MSRTDELTGVYNRRYFEEKVLDEIQRCNRSNTFFSLAILDIDYFKKINDTYGHLVGDEILKIVVKNIKDSIRKTDYIGRFGGDEFVIVLLELSEQSLGEKYHNHKKKYDQIRDIIETQTFKIINKVKDNISNKEININNEKIHITATFGITLYDNTVNNFDELIFMADKALYLAKENGRNCIGYYHSGKAFMFNA